MRFQDLLRRDGDTSAALAEAIARAEQAGRDAASRLDELSRRRASALIADDDTGIGRIEGEIGLVTRDADRAKLALAELSRRLDQARQREDLERRDAIHAEGAKARDAAVAIIEKRYRKWAAEGTAMLRELAALDQQVQDVNLRLAQAGDPRAITPGDEVARPHRGPGVPLLSVPVHRTARIPDALDGTKYTWPPATDIFSVDHPAPPAITMNRGAAA
jgi:hypothetical protein